MATTAANYWLLCISAEGRWWNVACLSCFSMENPSKLVANKLIFQSLLTRDSEISQALVKSAKNKRKQRLNESAKVFYDRP